MKVRTWFGTIVALIAGLWVWVHGVQAQAPSMPPPAPPTVSPTPSVSPSVSPTPGELPGTPIDPIPGSRTEPPSPSPSPSASPTTSPTASPTALPTPAPALMPAIIVPGNVEKFPIAGEHKDPANRFRIGLLKGAKVSPLGDSVLMELPDGHLAYTVVAQTAGQLGLANSVTIENLGQIARNALQRGEGFVSEQPQAIVNGLQMNWSGQLTIGGKTQPVNGVVIAKPGNNSVLLLTIAATEAGAADLPGAIVALSESFQGL